jgi:TP901 family phage tail tape measure protein
MATPQFSVKVNIKSVLGKLRIGDLIRDLNKRVKQRLKGLNLTIPVNITAVIGKINLKQLSKSLKAKIQLALTQAKEFTIKINVKPVLGKINLTQFKQQLKARVQTAASSIGNVTANIGAKVKSTGAKAIVAGNDAIRNSNNKLSDSFGDLQKTFRSFIRFAVQYQALVGALNAVKALAAGVIQLQDALVGISVITRSTISQMQTISASIKQVATTTQFSVVEIAKATQVLAQAGTAIRNIPETLQATANFAAATNTTLKTSADLLTTVKNVFSDLGVDEISDQLTNVVNISKILPEGLNTILSRAAQVSKANNIASDQLLSAVAVLKNAGIKDSTISTGFRQAILEILSPDAKTLSALEKRYAELGNGLAQDAIKARFQSFKNLEDPLKAVLDELASLGLGGSAQNQFSRVFDIRAENIINALIDQRDQLSKNQLAINNYGTASEGAEAQLQSLSKAFNNLGATITVVTSNLTEGFASGMAVFVQDLTDGVKKIGEFITEFKTLTGSTGSLLSSLAGIATTIASIRSGRGIFKSIGIGGVAAAGAQATQVGVGAATQASLGDKAAEIASGLIQTALVAFSFKGLFKGKLGKLKLGKGKAVPDVSEAADQLSDQTTQLATTSVALLSQLKGAASSIGALGSKLLKFVKLNPLGFLVSTLTTLGVSYFFTKFTEDLNAQAAAIGQQIKKLDIEAAAAASELSAQQSDAKQIEGIRSAASDTNEKLKSFFDGLGVTLDDDLNQLFADLSKGSTDSGSEQFKRGLEKLQEATGQAFSGKQILEITSLLNGVRQGFSQFEQIRVTQLGDIQKALELGEAGTEVQQQLIKLFNSLSSSEKSVLRSTITTIEERDKFNDLVSKFNLDRTESLKTAQANLTDQISDKSQEKLATEVRAAFKSGDFSNVSALLNDAISQGAEDRVKEIQKQIEAGAEVTLEESFLKSLFDPRGATFQQQERDRGLQQAGLTTPDLDSALQDAQRNAADKITSEADAVVRTLRDSVQTLSQVDFKEAPKAEEQVRKFSEAARKAATNLENAAQGSQNQAQLTKESEDLLKQGNALTSRFNAAKAVVADEETAGAQAAKRETEFSTAQAVRKANLSAQSLSLNQQLFALEQQGKQASAQYFSLLRERAELQIQFNQAQQQAIQGKLKEAVAQFGGEEGSFIDATKTVEETIKAFSTELGQKLLQIPEIAPVFQELIDSVQRSSDQANNLKNSLNDAAAKVDQAEVGGALNSLSDSTLLAKEARDALENRPDDDEDKKRSDRDTGSSRAGLDSFSGGLGSASNALEEMRKSVESMSETFDDARRSVTGRKLSSDAVEDVIDSISKLSGQDAVSAAQKAISGIQQLVSEGSISKSSAVSLLDEAEDQLAKAKASRESSGGGGGGGGGGFSGGRNAQDSSTQAEFGPTPQDILATLRNDSQTTTDSLTLSSNQISTAAAEMSTAAQILKEAAIFLKTSNPIGALSVNTNAANVSPDAFSSPVRDAAVTQSDKTPVNINVDGAKMRAQADEDQVKGFRRQVGVQNLKQGGGRIL